MHSTSLVIAAVTVAVAVSAPTLAAELTNPRSPPVVAYGHDGVTDWRGYIVSPKGRVFMADETRTSEMNAKLVAKGECERRGGHTCSLDKAIALSDDPDWVVVGMRCERGSRVGHFLGASTIDRGAAVYKAMEKAKKDGFGPASCSEIAMTASQDSR
jgi:hypothetical protein